MSKTPTKGAQVVDGTKVLIDKVAISGFRIKDIKKEFRQALAKNGILTVKAGPVDHVLLEDGSKYSYVYLAADGLVDYFRYGINTNGGISGRMELSVPSDSSHNLNCLTSKEWQARIKDICERIASKYGIILDITNAHYTYIEINKTLILNGRFADYYRVFERIMYLFPGTLRLGSLAQFNANDRKSDKVVPETYIRSSGKRGLTVEIYDKSAQLAKMKIVAAYNYCRFEIKLHTADKVFDAFGCNHVFYLTDSEIKKYFQRFVVENIIIPDQKDKESRKSKLKKILKKHYRPYSHTWVRETLEELVGDERREGHPTILSVDELIEVLPCLKYRNSDTLRHARYAFRIAAKPMGIYDQEDDKKWDELLMKLSDYST